MLRRKSCKDSDGLTYESDGVAGPLEGLDGGGVGHVDHGDPVHLEDDVVDAEAPVGGRRPTGYQLRDVDGGIFAHVGVVRAAGDAEPEAGAAPLQHDLLVLPFSISVDLQTEPIQR